MNSFEQFDIRLRIPDLWQQEALAALKQGRDVVVHAPTGAGKTYLVELLAQSKWRGQIVHSVPTRALANDKLREWRSKGWRVGIVTGDLTVDPEAPLVVATLETQKRRFVEGEGPELFVVDEYQMMSDPLRGINYELTIAMAPPQTRLLLLSGSVSNPETVVEWLRRIGRDPALVKLETRPVPLEEVRIDALAQHPPKSVKGYWPRLVAAALMADMGPILIFAPQRLGAEKLARHLAAALPVENPFALSKEQKRLAGVSLEKLLVKRVAFHHSGLSYQQRSGLVEPLAKAGQLRVVVSTTGLAAGVNFSMRSVLVTEESYKLDHFQQQIMPDELLQMFGRAGRRGLDEVGYALTVPDRPRLRDARPLPARRPAMVDWPSLIGIMDAAVVQGRPPFETAVAASGRLFSKDPVSIGVERSLTTGEVPCGLMIDAARARRARPKSVEMKNANGEWRPLGEMALLPLKRILVLKESSLVPFLSLPERVREIGPGSLISKRSRQGKRYGKRVAIAFLDKGSEDRFSLSGWFRRGLAHARGLPSFEALPKRWSGEELDALSLEELARAIGVGRCARFKREGRRWVVHLDLQEYLASAYSDGSGDGILNPEIRETYPSECRGCREFEHCQAASARRSPALQWLQLELIDGEGAPTRRGKVFGFFQGGEGLAVAAALEDRSYSVDAIALDLANVRAGFRFEEHGQFSHRLARACRLAYGDRSCEGYLKHGLPPQYGEGAAEVVALAVQEPGKLRQVFGDMLKPGDVQRVRLEWQSLLRQIAYAPDMEWDRWQELKQAVRLHLEEDVSSLQLNALSLLEPGQQTRVSHRLRFPRG